MGVMAMRISRMLLRTQKQIPAEAELPSHQLILRAGLARRLAAGIYTLTPLGWRAIRRLEAIVREEMARIGGQELLMPVVQPAELWQESGRYAAIDASLARFADRNGHPMVLAMTHEEAVTDLARGYIDSYRQLPLMLFQIQTKFRDEPRPRAGLIRLREFLMKDGYSFHATAPDLDAYYEQVVDAYRAVFARAGVPVLVVQSDTGMMGGKDAHEFMLLAPGGEDSLVVCPACGYAANQEVAVADKGPGPDAAVPVDPLRPIHTPGAVTIAALCAAAGCTPAETLKSVFYTTGDKQVLALIRGDLEINPIKLRNLVGAEVRLLTPEEAAAAGLVAGYAGPVELSPDLGAYIVADDSVPVARNLVAGANRPDYHLAGVNYGRDFTANLIGDVALAAPGQPCRRCGGALEVRRGIEAGNTFKLGLKYSTAMGATFANEDGDVRPMIMGCYGIGITRLLACVLEQNHDADGIIWPVSVAPYPCHLMTAGKDPAAAAAAAELHGALGEERVLYDDRDLSPGVKFKDADLLGMPVRITVSARSLAAGGAELRARRTGATRTVPLDQVPAAVDELLAELAAASQ